jgi:hypothetical protein
MDSENSEERNYWSPRYLAIYKVRRCQMAFADRTPSQQLSQLHATY